LDDRGYVPHVGDLVAFGVSQVTDKRGPSACNVILLAGK
jgi:hypothetical protein